MKITDVRTAEIKGHGYSTYVRIYTDEGVIGNGECIHGGEGCPADGPRPKALHHRREPAQRRHALREDAPRPPLRRGDGRGNRHRDDRASRSRSGIWPAKALGVPVYQLLGGKFRDTVRLYCDSHAGKDFSPEAYAERAQEVVALGLRRDQVRCR